MIGLLLSLFFLIYLIYRGVPVLIVSPLMAMVAVFLGSDIPVLYSWTGPFMQSVVGFVAAYFPIFLVGAIFGTLMNASGAALTIAQFISQIMGPKKAILAVILASFLLTYGGVSVFVVVFAVLPIARTIFINSDYPRRLLPSAICAGCLPAYVSPGSAQFINTIPIPIFKTTIYSGMDVGIIGTIVWLVIGVWYMTRLVKRAKDKGEGYGEGQESEKLSSQGNIFVAITPVAIVIVGNILLTKYFELDYVINHYAGFGGVQGIWAITVSLCVAIIVTLFLYRKEVGNITRTLAQGANDSLAPIFNTSTQVGYGGVVKMLPVFAVIKAAVFAIPGSAMIAAVVGTAVLAGIVGSTSGGVGLAMLAFGKDLLALANAHHIPAGLMHRIIVFSASTLDTLPHSGFIITLLGVCGLTHKQSYKELFIVTCLFPMFAVIVMLSYATAFLI
ncbi:TPA: GntP family permease [Klebsiella pneumoniae]|nr:GntP family permease [Klebsiella pneumoniae]